MRTCAAVEVCLCTSSVSQKDAGTRAHTSHVHSLTRWRAGWLRSGSTSETRDGRSGSGPACWSGTDTDRAAGSTACWWRWSRCTGRVWTSVIRVFVDRRRKLWLTETLLFLRARSHVHRVLQMSSPLRAAAAAAACRHTPTYFPHVEEISGINRCLDVCVYCICIYMSTTRIHWLMHFITTS